MKFNVFWQYFELSVYIRNFERWQINSRSKLVPFTSNFSKIFKNLKLTFFLKKIKIQKKSWALKNSVENSLQNGAIKKSFLRNLNYRRSPPQGVFRSSWREPQNPKHSQYCLDAFSALYGHLFNRTDSFN